MDTHDLLTGGDASRRYRIYFAPDYAAVPEAPLVLCLDADDQFVNVLEAYEHLRATNRVQPLALVGIGYGVGYRHKGNRRIPDYTPEPSADEPVSGGGPVFLRWLETELVPWLTAERGLRQTRRAVVGHSLGGLFGLYAFFHDTRLFEGCLALAPSLWYAEHAQMAGLSAHREHNARWPGRLFVGVGERDSKSMQRDIAELERAFSERPYDELAACIKRFPHRDHFNVISPGLREGLAWLFPA